MASDPLLISIVLSDTTVQSLLWKTVGTQVEVVNQSQIKNFKDKESLVLATDETLQELGPESEPVNQVIFGVPEDWLETEDIKADKKPLLKKITQDLELKPQGYVVIEEALSFYFKAQEPQFSALLLGITTTDLKLRLFKFGKLMSTQVVGRSDDIIPDLTEALARLQHLDQIKSLPTKFQLYSLVLESEEIIELQQKLVNFDWTKDDTFFYQPIFEVVSPEILALALTSQAHFSLKGEVEVANPALPLEEKEEVIQEAEVVEEVPEMQPATIAKSFGIPISVTPPPKLEETPEELELAAQDNEPSNNRLKDFVLAHKFALIGGFAAGLLALILLTFIASKTILQAQVEVILKKQAVSKQVLFALDPDATESDPAQLVLAARIVEKEVSGQKIGSTSGVKLIGDKAKGQVQLFNKTTAEKTFEPGTVIQTGEIAFVLDAEVKVASASVSSSSGSETKTYGKADAAVTAGQIGTDGNVKKDTKFTVASFDSSSYEAVATADFSGGSSREVRVVSQKDRDDLRKALLEELKQQADATFKTESVGGKYLVGTGKSSVSSAEFDTEVGAEANNITLQLTAQFTGVEYAADDLKPLAAAVLADQIPQGYVLTDEEPNILSAPAEEASPSGQVKLDAEVSAQAVPQVNLDDWKKEISGKSKSEATRVLQSKQEVQSAEVTFQPSWLGSIFSWLPSTNKITLNQK